MIAKIRFATLSLLAAMSGASLAQADVVSVWNRGDRIRLEGKEAEPIGALVVDLMQRHVGDGGPPSTAVIQAARKTEVVVEVQFDEPREFAVAGTNQGTRPQYLLVLLTGADGGASGNDATIFAGRKIPADAVPPIAAAVGAINAPDEYGISYYGSYDTPGSLEPLRLAVEKLGVDAPAPTPRPTPDRRNVLTPADKQTPPPAGWE